MTLFFVLASLPTLLWESRYNGPDNLEDRAAAMVADSIGNCWVAGFSYGLGTDFQFTVAAFAPDGRLRWSQRYGSPANSEDRAWVIARDSTGAIVAAGGTLADPATGWDVLLARYDADSGTTHWLHRLDLPWHSDDRIAALGITASNNPIAAVTSRRSGGRRDTDIVLVLFSADGETLWTRSWDGASRGNDEAVALALGDNSVYVVGRTTSGGLSTDIVLLRFDLDGTLVWSRTIDGPGRATDFPAQVVYRAGQVFVAGTVTGLATSYDWYVAVFDSNGRNRWHHQWDGNGRSDILEAIALDSAGTVIATGHTTSVDAGIDAAIVKLDAAGRRVWTRRYNGERNSTDRGWRIAIGPEGPVVAASSVGSSGFPELVLLGLSPTGDSLWAWRRPNPVPGETRPVGIALLTERSNCQQSNPVLCAGWTLVAPGGNFDWFVLRLAPAGRPPDPGN